MQTMLQRLKVADLFITPQVAQATASPTMLDGFFGTNPQRLSLAILTATPDSLRPGLVHVSGKTRYQQQVSRFEGVIQLTRLADYYDQVLLLSQGDEALRYVPDSTTEAGGYIANARAYSASAAFRFHGTAPATTVLTGRALVDFWVSDTGEIGFMRAPAQGAILAKAPTKGSGLVLKGNWQNAPGQPAKPFLVSSDIFLLSPGIVADFGVGDRSASVNPKYTKLGWANYWQNDEWWADSPQPRLSL